jgi:sugar/nucleoside kinase (ribokinase family)
MALGAHVALYTVVPTPTPRCFQLFLNQAGVDRRHLLAIPGPCPVMTRIRNGSGRRVLQQRGVSSWLPIPPPRGWWTGFDVILADLSGLASPPRALLQSLRSEQETAYGRPRIGLRADESWTREDLSATNEGCVWTFFRAEQAQRIGQRITGIEADLDSATRAKRLKLACRTGKLVVHLGARGALLLNDHGPYWAQPCPVKVGDAAGIGDTLITITMLSSAAGADDHTSLNRGVAAATGLLAGLGLPASLEELDA